MRISGTSPPVAPAPVLHLMKSAEPYISPALAATARLQPSPVFYTYRVHDSSRVKTVCNVIRGGPPVVLFIPSIKLVHVLHCTVRLLQSDTTLCVVLHIRGFVAPLRRPNAADCDFGRKDGRLCHSLGVPARKKEKQPQR